MKTCIYCGCTDDRACTYEPDDEEREARSGLFLAGVPLDDFDDDQPANVTCFWISDDPPVCSAPACRAKFEAAA